MNNTLATTGQRIITNTTTRGPVHQTVISITRNRRTGRIRINVIETWALDKAAKAGIVGWKHIAASYGYTSYPLDSYQRHVDAGRIYAA